MNSTALLLLFVSVSQTFHLPKGMLSAICWAESTHRVHVLHKDDGVEDSVGVCQLHPSTARWMGFRGTKKELFNPKVNAYYAAKYTRHLLNRYHQDTFKAIAAYNAGSYIEESKDIPVNKIYVLKVLRAWRQNR